MDPDDDDSGNGQSNDDHDNIYVEMFIILYCADVIKFASHLS